VIRDILRGRLAADPDPRGVQLRGAHVEGRLDLAHVSSALPLALGSCLLDRGVDVSYADLGPLRLEGCRIEHPSVPAFNGFQLRTPDLVLTDATVVGSGAFGAVNLRESRIGGTLSFDRATLANDTGPALQADYLRVEGPLLMRHGFTATGADEFGAVNLTGAEIGELDAAGATVRNASGPAILAEAARFTGSVLLWKGFAATGGVDLRFVRIGGTFDCSGATFSSPSGSALCLAGTAIVGSVLCRRGGAVDGVGELGAVSFHLARIGDTVEWTGGTVRNPSGPAFYAEGVTVNGGMLFRGGFAAAGSGQSGALSLVRARVSGTVDLLATSLANPSGPALLAAHAVVGGQFILGEGSTLAGASAEGAAVLFDTDIGGTMYLSAVDVRNSTGPAVSLMYARIGQSLVIGPGLRATGGGNATVDLSHTAVGGVLHFIPEQVVRLSGAAAFDVDGLTYVGLPQGVDSAGWLRLLQTSTPRYAAQPYQHLAAAERAAGHDGAARRVLMAQRRHQIDSRALTGAVERMWAKVTGVTLGYGYQPWRALVGLFLVLLLSGLAAGFMGEWGGLAKVRTPPSTAVESCPVIDRIGFGLDAGAPLITSRAKCETTGSAWGTGLTVVSWVAKVLAWAFATLFIAGFTGVVRKT
jgi:hypothetical protein